MLKISRAKSPAEKIIEEAERILRMAGLPIDWVVDRATGEKRLFFSELPEERRAAAELIDNDFVVEAV